MTERERKSPKPPSTAGSPRVRTVLQLGGDSLANDSSPGRGRDDVGANSDLTSLSGDALKKLVQSERALNKDYRYTLMLPERVTTARMSDLLASRDKPSAKEMSVLQRYAGDLLAENEKMLRQLDKMTRTGTYSGAGSGGAYTATGTNSSPLMLSGTSSGSYHAPPVGISANKNALKRSQTSGSAGRSGLGKSTSRSPTSRDAGSPRSRSPPVSGPRSPPTDRNLNML